MQRYKRLLLLFTSAILNLLFFRHQLFNVFLIKNKIVNRCVKFKNQLTFINFASQNTDLVNHRLKKIYPIILLILFIGPILGYFIYLNIQKQLVRENIKAEILGGIELDNLVTFTLDVKEIKSKFRWIHEHEFEYQGKFYDVVKTEISGSKVIFHCFPDDKESQLQKEIDKLISQALGKNNKDKKNQQELQNLFKLFYTHDFHKNQLTRPKDSSIKYSNSIHNYLMSIAPCPLVPPPQFG